MSTLSPKARKALPSSSFALPSQRAYPIPDASHARNALARAVQHATPAERAEIEAKVHARFPDMGKKAGANALQAKVDMARRYYATGTSRVGMGIQTGVGGPNGPGQTITSGSWTGPDPQSGSPQPQGQNQDLRAKLFPNSTRKAYADGTDDVRPSKLPASVGGGSASSLALREEIERRRAARAAKPPPASSSPLPQRSYSSGPPRAANDSWLPSHGVPPQPPVSKDTPIVDVRPARARPPSAGPEYRPLKGDATEPPLSERPDRTRAPANAPGTYGARQVSAERQNALDRIARVRDAIRSGQRFDKSFDKLRSAPDARTASEGPPPKGAVAETAEDVRRRASSLVSKVARDMPDAPAEAPKPRSPGFGQRVPTPLSSSAPAGPSVLDRVRSAISGTVDKTAQAINRATAPRPSSPASPTPRAPGFGQRKLTEMPDRDYAGGTPRVPGRLPKRGTTDVVPAMLTPGEAVLNRGAARAIGRDKIAAANARGSGAPMSGIERAMHAHADKCHPVSRPR